MKMVRYKVRYLLAGLVVLVLGISTVMAQQRLSTSGEAFDGRFTYQGRLDGAEGPVTAVCDLQVGLWDAASAGTQQGSTETLTDVAVTEGLFTVLLNTDGTFGTQVFDGAPRYLEIAVQCGEETTFTTLAPRHALTPAPYALTSGSTQALQGHVVSDAAPATGEALVWDGSTWRPQVAAGEPGPKGDQGDPGPQGEGFTNGIMILTDSATPPDGYTATGLIVNTSNNLWSTKMSMPTARNFTAAGVMDGHIYVIGGIGSGGALDALDVVEAYDPVTDSWSTKAPVPTARYGVVAGVVNGQLYVIGGNSSGALDVVEAYDPVTDSWSTKAPMPTVREFAVAGVVDGQLYVIGGSDSGALDVVEAYDPVTDSWSTKAPMPTARWGAVAGVVDGQLYVIGGIGSGGISDVVEAYDPVTDSWSTKAPMPTAQYAAAAGVVDGQVYVIGGYGSVGTLDVVEAYDPVTDSWSTKAAMPTARYAAAAGVVDRQVYVIGGFANGPLGVVEAYGFPTGPNLYIHVKN